jgi:phosphate/sulfate permease
VLRTSLRSRSIRSIVAAWVFTFPAAGLAAALTFWILKLVVPI